MCKDNPVRMCGNCATPHCKTLERIQQVMPPKTTFIKPDAKLINKIIVKTGAMQSGKTEDEIVQYFRLTKINELSCVIFKPAVDTRSDENCVESFTKLTAPCVSCKTLSFCDDIINYLKENCHVIIIEEAQFFGEELIDFVDMMARKYKKCVYVYALNGDSDRNVFGHVSKLMPKWDEHICFKASCALCKDGKDGIFTLCLVKKTGQLLIGNQGKQYITVCADCHSNPENNALKKSMSISQDQLTNSQGQSTSTTSSNREEITLDDDNAI